MHVEIFFLDLTLLCFVVLGLGREPHGYDTVEDAEQNILCNSS